MALITALLVVALATIATVAMTSRQQIDIRRMQNVLESEQIRSYLYGVEGLAGTFLAEDRKDNEVDHLGEEWAKQRRLPFQDGLLTVYLDDAQSRFNLNNLVIDGKTSGEDLARLRRLLAALELAPNLEEAVVDWIDTNIDPTPNGAEDTVYLGLELPYRAANRPMGDSSELLLVKGFDADSYRKLAPYVTALPGRTPINLNTAPAEVLMTLHDNLTRAAVDNFVSARKEKHFESVEDALKHEAFAGQEIKPEGLSVATAHFVIMSDISVGRLQQRFASIVQRSDNGAATLIKRSQLYL